MQTAARTDLNLTSVQAAAITFSLFGGEASLLQINITLSQHFPVLRRL